MIKRFYHNKLASLLEPNKVLVIYGPRRVGKTTLVKSFLNSFKGLIYQSTGENIQLRQVLESSDFSKIIPFFQDYEVVFIDEAQWVNNIGLGLKIIVDQIPGIKVIATGSSSFDLSNKIGEPLVGRQRVVRLYPLSVMELKNDLGGAYVIENLKNLMIFGSYPEVIEAQSFAHKKDYLEQIRDSYLFKDILELENIKNSKKIYDLLRLVAFQIGQEVSHHELGTQLGLSKNTVARYLDLLEKAFVLVNVRGLSRNLRKEVSKTSRYYFYDNGVRNAVVGNFNFVENRNDVGQLWENFMFMERLKCRQMKRMGANVYFWRTYDQQEVDLVEEREGKLVGFEFKWGGKKAKAPRAWLETYDNASFEVITPENYLEFVS
ncbi:ATP-binding protein [Patescibacteria group bacterium]|nr:ATP-binding protein [Patescibacteria group bacterium]MBU1966965.1 ATP-binding protein [Patescibacteria group bacterium]